MKIFQLLFLLTIILLFSCKKEETTRNTNIDPAFIDYVDRFFNEAELRGLELSRDNLEVVFEETPNFCGFGYADYQGTGLRRVEINPTDNCWNSRNDLEKEQFMFHELGHAILARSHKSTFLPNGSPRSIMCSSETCDPWGTYNKFRLKQRTYYVDELFDQITANPEWGKEKTVETIVFKEDFEATNFGWDYFTTSNGAATNYENIIKLNEEGTSNVATITSKDFGAGAFNSWRYVIREIPNIPEGSSLELRAKVTTRNLNGEGVSIVLRTDSESNGQDGAVSGFSSTQGVIQINGNQSNRTYTTRINYYPTDVKVILIFLLMQDESKGAVEFDDIELVYLQ